MKPLAALLVALALVGARTLAAEEETPEERLLRRAGAIVSVRAIFHVRMTRDGTTREQDVAGVATGVAVDPTGLVLVRDGRTRIREIERKARDAGASVALSLGRIHVLFGNDGAEHETVLVARDPALGVLFLQVLGLAGSRVEAIDLAAGRPPRIGERLLGLSRFDRELDFAPHVKRLTVTMETTHPGQMWGIAGDFGSEEGGLPAFALDGTPVGMVHLREGTAIDGSETVRTFLLAPSAVVRGIEAAKKRVPEALAKADRGEAVAPPAGESQPPR